MDQLQRPVLSVGDRVEVIIRESSFRGMRGFVGGMNLVEGHDEIVAIVFDGDTHLYHFTLDELKRI